MFSLKSNCNIRFQELASLVPVAVGLCCITELIKDYAYFNLYGNLHSSLL